MNAQEKVDKLRTRLKKQKGHYPEVSELSGLSMSWIMKFLSGVKNDPKLSTVEALTKALYTLENRQRAQELRKKRARGRKEKTSRTESVGI